MITLLCLKPVMLPPQVPLPDADLRRQRLISLTARLIGKMLDFVPPSAVSEVETDASEDP